MRVYPSVLLAIAVVCFVQTAFSRDRDPHQRAAFVKAHPCPPTGNVKGRCPGYVVDHIEPLCAGGPDHPSNMQWQTVAEAKKKDRLERQQCSKQRTF